MPVPFPNIQPTGRSYNPGRFPQAEFSSLNGAKTVMVYGQHRVDASLELEFSNIKDADAAVILANYEAVNQTWDYVTFASTNGGIGADAQLADYLMENPSSGRGLRYRYAKPPEVRSVKPGISTVVCSFIAVLDAA